MQTQCTKVSCHGPSLFTERKGRVCPPSVRVRDGYKQARQNWPLHTPSWLIHMANLLSGWTFEWQNLWKHCHKNVATHACRNNFAGGAPSKNTGSTPHVTPWQDTAGKHMVHIQLSNEGDGGGWHSHPLVDMVVIAKKMAAKY